MRNLASIQMIVDVEPIEGADMIEKVTVLGWEIVVAKKDGFKPPDKVIYVEIDSVMPDRPEYEFLRPRKFRIRTIKLKGQVSQGLVLPIKGSPLEGKNVTIGQDVTEEMGITKYLTPSEREENSGSESKLRRSRNPLVRYMMKYAWFRKMMLRKKSSESWPKWVSKTDEERIQNMPGCLRKFADEVVYVTEKVDYQSATFTSGNAPKFNGLIGRLLPFKNVKLIVCSRNMPNHNKASLYWKIAEKYKMEDILRRNPNITIQGEQGDTKVQGNKYKITEPTLWVFDVYDHVAKKHFGFIEMQEFCDKWGLQTVPFVTEKRLGDIGSTVQELVQFSRGKSLINKDVHREGVVIRCVRDGKKILSFKVINPDFLLKYED